MISIATKKELRMVLPEWSAAMLLASSPLILLFLGIIFEATSPYNFSSLELSILLLALGCSWLATAVFGKENTHGTAELMYSLPLSRKQVCLRKAGIAFLALGSSVTIFIVCTILARNWQPSEGGRFLASSYEKAGCIVFLITFGPGLLFSAFFRSFHEAFWLTILTPLSIIATIGYITVERFKDNTDALFIGSLSFYGILAAILALVSLIRWQATGRATQNIVFRLPQWVAKTSQGKRATRPNRSMLTMLILKELRIHQISIAITFTFSTIYAAFIYITNANEWKSLISLDDATMLRSFWLLVPASIGASAISEERAMGVSAWQSTLPASTRLQWFIKLSTALVLGLILGGVAPLPLDYYFLSRADMVDTSRQITALQYLNLFLITWFGPVVATLIGFFASSYCRNLLQSLLLTAAISLMLSIQMIILTGRYIESYSFEPWLLIGLVMLITIAPILVYRSFKNYASPSHLSPVAWFILGMGIVTTLSTFVISSLAFSRFWDDWSPKPAIVQREAAPIVEGKIILHQWGFTILNSQGRLFRLSEWPGRTSQERVLAAHPIGPEKTWKSVIPTTKRYFAITTTGEFWSFAPEKTDTRAINNEAPPLRFESDIPWKELHHYTPSKPFKGNKYLLALKTDGSLYQAELSQQSELVTPWRLLPIEQRFSTIKPVDTNHWVAITLGGQLAMIGGDPMNLLTIPLERDDSDPALYPVTIVDSSTDWHTIYQHRDAIALPASGYPLSETESFNSSSNWRDVSPMIFEKTDGSIWAPQWLATTYLGQFSADAPLDRRLVEISKNDWLVTTRAKRTIFSPSSQTAIRKDQSLWNVNRRYHFNRRHLSILPHLNVETIDSNSLSERTDWVSIERFFSENTTVGLTENDILWTWGRPLEELIPMKNQHQNYIRLLPHPQTPRPIFDMRNGKSL